jgi:chorismate--pyruvate lyase
MQKTIWHAALPYFVNRAPAAMRPWLSDQESLTARLVAACDGRFSVHVIEQGWQPPLISERQVLGLSDQESGFVRHVQLLCDKKPWVFARTFIPASSLNGPLNRLTHLGTRPLGAVLFASKTLRRQHTQIAALGFNDSLRHIAGAARDQKIWGRRSVFYTENKPLIVSEFFLPGMNQYLSASW